MYVPLGEVRETAVRRELSGSKRNVSGDGDGWHKSYGCE